MSDLQVMYDPTLEVAAIVDLDTNMGWGPICAGTRGGELLQAFVDGMPFDITILTPEQARDIFLSVFRDDAAAAIQDAGTASDNPVGTPGDPTATEQAQATAGAVAQAGAPPEPAPADADMAADTSQTDTVTPDPTPPVTQTDSQTVAPNISTTSSNTANCLICNPTGAGSSNPSCPVCGGTGHVQAT